MPALPPSFRHRRATPPFAWLVLASLLAFGARADPLTDLLAPEAAPAAAEQGTPDTIDTESSPADDAGIHRRLSGIFAALDALDGVEPSVSSGIVTLGGTADSARGAERAVEIASQVQGVVEVVDEMSVDANVARRLRATLERLEAGALSILATLPVLLLALAVVALFWWLGRWVGRRRGVFQTLAPNGFIAELLGGIVRVAVVLLGLFLALSLLDATSIIGTVLGAAGIVGLAVGFAVRDTVENWIASVLLSLRTPFVARDYVLIGEHQGAVARLTSRATILISLDGNHIRIPNATVYKSTIVNYTTNPARRFEFTVGVDTDLDLDVAQQTALEAVHAVAGVLEEPLASVIVEALGDSNVTLTVMAWIDQRESDVRKVRSEAIRFVKQAFDEAGIVMPEPIYRVNLRTAAAGALPVSVAPSSTEPRAAPDSLAEGPADGSTDGVPDAHGREPTDGRRHGAAPARPSGAAREGSAPTAAPGTRTEAGARVDRRERPPSRSRPPARDTSLDGGVVATLEREIEDGEAENLLDADAPRE